MVFVCQVPKYPSTRSLDAQYFGLAQRRERVFIVGCLGDGAAAAKVLFELEGGDGDPAENSGAGERIARPITTRPGMHHDPSYDTYIAGTLGSLTGGRRHDPSDTYMLDAESKPTVVFPDLRRHDEHHRRLVKDKPSLNADNSDLVFTHDVADPLTAGSAASPGVNHPGRRQEDDWNLAASTGAVVRRLTPLECERLQGFEDGWTCLCGAHGVTLECTCPDAPRLRAIGNAVAVPVGAWVARRLVEVAGA